MAKAKPIKFITTFSQFFSTRVLGEGGSGIVYEVQDDTGVKYAIKLLKSQGITSDKRKRFKNEIIFCQRSSHANIVPIIDSGVLLDNDVEIPFYVMPIYEASLRDLIDDGIHSDTVIEFFAQILDGAEAAHLQNIFHRDIKPENILCKKAENRIVLADFGIARFTEDDLYTAVETKAQDRLANFQYAAPEQRVRGKSTDRRADIYAIGLILNEMFTHEIPQGTGYKTIASIAPMYSYLDEIVDKMIRQNPNERFNTIQDVKALLKIRGADYISEQKLNTLKSTVIPKSEIDDPLITNPIKIVSFDWENGHLTLFLSQAINGKWVNAMHRMGSYSSLLGKGPDSFTFNGHRAMISAREHEVQNIINYFKSWIPLTTERYKNDIEEEYRYQEEQERKKIQAELDAEETKARLRKSIKL